MPTNPPTSEITAPADTAADTGPCDALTRPGAFAQLPAAVLVLPDAAAKLYGILARHVDGRGRCWPGQAHLIADTGWSESKLRRTLRLLEAAGLLTTTQRSVTPGSGPTNVYQLAGYPQTGHPRPVAPVTSDRQNDTQGTKNPQRARAHASRPTPAGPARGRKPTPPKPDQQLEDAVTELVAKLPSPLRRRFDAEPHHRSLRRDLRAALATGRTVGQLHRAVTGNGYGDLATASSVSGALAWRLRDLAKTAGDGGSTRPPSVAAPRPVPAVTVDDAGRCYVEVGA